VELKNDYLKAPLLSRRSLLSVVVLIGAVTGGNLWIHRGDPALGYARYTGYGFSIDYSQRMTSWESGLGGGPASQAAGTVQFTNQEGILEQYGIIWVKPGSMSTYIDQTAAGALDYVFVSTEMSGTQISDRGETRTMTREDRDIIYQTFGLEDSGFTIPGLIGAWYSEEVEKFMILYLIYVPDISQIEVASPELEQRWLGYLDAIEYHSTS
jgi:hypothetical protein